MALTKTDLSKLPAFSQLPIQPGVPAGAAWGVFGDHDELGCLNFLTPEGVVDAARLVHSGKTFRLDTKIGFAQPPLFGRAKVAHRIVPLGPTANDDIYDNYNTQEGSQWDGLAHVGHVRHKLFYGGVRPEEITGQPGGRLSIHHWAAKFVGRGVLIDAYAFRKSQGRPVNPMESEVYSLDELKAALEAQRTTLQPGTILLVRTGWMESYESLPAEAKARFDKFENIKSIGVERSQAMAAWLWDNRVAAIGTDNPAVESLPFDLADENALHYLALPLLGLPLGELFVLAPLAEDCARDGRYEFMVVSAPMNGVGGIASPPNALAIK